MPSMPAATYQYPTTPKHIENLDVGTLSGENKLGNTTTTAVWPFEGVEMNTSTDTATRSGATGRDKAARHRTATDELQKGTKLTKTGASWEWAKVHKNMLKYLALATLPLALILSLWVWARNRHRN